MKVFQNPSLKALNTFGVDAAAALLIAIEGEEDLLSLPAFDATRDFLLGAGSNVLITTDVPGTVYHNRIRGKAVVEKSSEYAWIEAGAGENWHELVRWTLEQGYSGLENLSLIPGSVGAAPIQNIGAYGVEIASVLDSLTAWDWQRARWTTFGVDECELAYRDSRFKSAEPGRYLVTSVRLRLDRTFRPRLEYAGLVEELGGTGVAAATAGDVSAAVTRIRRRKLPDPAQLGNAGSFFKNPVVSDADAAALHDQCPGLPAWPAGTGATKLSAAWMVEACGLKGYREGDAGVSEQHALVLVNHGSARGHDMLRLAETVRNAVVERFGVQLEIEPTVVEFPR